MKKPSKDVYIDIDGVVLTKGVVPAAHLDILLKHILSKYSVSWLTSRCSGDSISTIAYLSQFLPQESMALVKRIKPTAFRLDKTEAIDFHRKFFWLESELFASEEIVLKKYGKYDSWIPVNLVDNPNQLLEISKSI